MEQAEATIPALAMTPVGPSRLVHKILSTEPARDRLRLQAISILSMDAMPELLTQPQGTILIWAIRPDTTEHRVDITP